MKRPTVLLITRNVVLSAVVARELDRSYETICLAAPHAVLDYAYSNMPSLLIIDVEAGDPSSATVLMGMRDDPVFRHLPVLALLGDVPSEREWEHLPMDDYLLRQDCEREVGLRAMLCIRRVERTVEVNPLTRLPGNISIRNEIRERLDGGEQFALGYADLDHFKPLNDRYGFARGDEMIKMTARVIVNIVKDSRSRESFVGHIGGDDFVFLAAVDRVEKVAGEMVGAFDAIVPIFYDTDDREQGFILSKDREGNARPFPFVSLSIGIADNGRRTYSHPGEMIQVATEMKAQAKTHRGSCFMRDRRAAEGDAAMRFGQTGQSAYQPLHDLPG